MAKTTVHTGASVDPVPSPRIKRPTLGGEPKLAGTNSSTSSKKDETKTSEENQLHQPHVQTTESPSGKQTTEDSSAHTTVGVGRKTPVVKSAKKANTKSTKDSSGGDDFDDFD